MIVAAKSWEASKERETERKERLCCKKARNK